MIKRLLEPFFALYDICFVIVRLAVLAFGPILAFCGAFYLLLTLLETFRKLINLI